MANDRRIEADFSPGDLTEIVRPKTLGGGITTPKDGKGPDVLHTPDHLQGPDNLGGIIRVDLTNE
jgi:hypothetical protein